MTQLELEFELALDLFEFIPGDVLLEEAETQLDLIDLFDFLPGEDLDFKGDFQDFHYDFKDSFSYPLSHSSANYFISHS